MTEAELKQRTRDFGLRCIRLVASLPRGTVEDVLGRQLLRSATSVGANYRAACRAKSPADMAAKLAIVEEEADESIYWLELLIDAKVLAPKHAQGLLAEGNELVAITVASIKTLRCRAIQNPKSKI